ncbi:MAG TPA: isochorismate synthase [Ktedonobacteraceae bacterium]|jgi:isochorismate synthase
MTGAWPISCQATDLQRALRLAAARAAQTGGCVPASVVLAYRATDPLCVWQAFQELAPGECFYWEQPERQVALVGAGVALSMHMQGEQRFIEAARAWRRLRAEMIVGSAPEVPLSADHGPVLIGGFSFDPGRPRSYLWQHFPDGLLLLPRLLFRQHAGVATLTFSALVHTMDTLDTLSRAIDAELMQLRALLSGPDAVALPAYAPARLYALRDIWPVQTWQDLVADAVSSIGQGAYAKVVLAREAEVISDTQPFDLARTLQNLRQGYANACIFALQRGEQTFIGATPERLVRARSGRLHTVALAGSAPRGADAQEDRRLGCELLHSPKNRREHEIVIAMLRASLAHLCSGVQVARAPALLRLKNIQHLQTAIVGQLLPERTLLEALHTLHPTPAVGGSPTEAALHFIRTRENLDRGWYAGPLGWVDLVGNGEFVVALRSALLKQHTATLFAGCGIVKDSDPGAEYAESCLKLQVMLRGLAGEEE